MFCTRVVVCCCCRHRYIVSAAAAGTAAAATATSRARAAGLNLYSPLPLTADNTFQGFKDNLVYIAAVLLNGAAGFQPARPEACPLAVVALDIALHVGGALSGTCLCATTRMSSLGTPQLADAARDVLMLLRSKKTAATAVYHGHIMIS